MEEVSNSYRERIERRKAQVRSEKIYKRQNRDGLIQMNDEGAVKKITEYRGIPLVHLPENPEAQAVLTDTEIFPSLDRL